MFFVDFFHFLLRKIFTLFSCIHSDGTPVYYVFDYEQGKYIKTPIESIKDKISELKYIGNGFYYDTGEREL